MPSPQMDIHENNTCFQDDSRLITCSGVLRKQKLRSACLRSVFPLKPEVGQKIATHALPAARIFFHVLISTIMVHSPSHCLVKTVSLLTVRCVWV